MNLSLSLVCIFSMSLSRSDFGDYDDEIDPIQCNVVVFTVHAVRYLYTALLHRTPLLGVRVAQPHTAVFLNFC